MAVIHVEIVGEDLDTKERLVLIIVRLSRPVGYERHRERFPRINAGNLFEDESVCRS